MNAISVANFGGPEVLTLVESPLPEVQSGQVLVRLHAAGINPVETYIRAGKYPKLPQLPYTPGTEGAGVISAFGADVKSVKVGDRVFLSGTLTGTYAEYALCEETQVHALPDASDFEHGAALGVAYATAYRALFQRGSARAGETVLIHGASGGVGSAATQLAKSAGLRVLGTAGSASGMQLVKGAGADVAFDHTQAGYLQEILESTQGRGVDCILEMLANVNLGNDLTLLAPKGRVVIIGSRGPVEIDPRNLMMREADIRGLIGGLASPEERAATFKAIGEALAKGKINPSIGHRFPLTQAAAAHREVMEGKSVGKIVLVM